MQIKHLDQSSTKPYTCLLLALFYDYIVTNILTLMLSQENVINLFTFLWPYTESFHSSKELLDLPGDSVVKTLCFHCSGHGFYPWSGKFCMPHSAAKQTNKQKTHPFPSNTLSIWLSRWFSSKESTCWCRGLRFEEDPLEEEMATHLYSCLDNSQGQRSLAGHNL